MRRLAPARLICLLALLLQAHAATAGTVATSVTRFWEQGWPMVGHDPGQTGRSPGLGPRTPRLLWSYRGIGGPVAIGPDGSVYGWTARGLVALSAAGRQRWIVAAQEGMGGPPALGTDGLVRVSGDLSWARGARSTDTPHVSLLAIAPRGRQRWAIRALPWATVPASLPFSKGAAPIVTAANLLYVPFVGPAYTARQNTGVEVVRPNGAPLRRLLPGYGGPIAVAPDGTVYELGYNYADRLALLACAAGGGPCRQRFVTYTQSGSILVGPHGRVYASDGAGWGSGDSGEVAAYTTDGRLLWRVPTRGVATLAERGDGALLVADRGGLAALSPGGARLWRVHFGRQQDNVQASASPAVDAAGYAYVGGADGMVRLVAPDGTPRWTLRAGGTSSVGPVPAVALGPSGVLAVVGTDGVLRLFH